MTNLGWLAAIAGTHLWHSVALAGVLALTLIASRKMAGSGRYALCAFAMVAAIVLPAIALTPGSSLINRLLTAVDAPISFMDGKPEFAAFGSMAEASPVPVPAIAFGGDRSSGEILRLEIPETNWSAAAAPEARTASFGGMEFVASPLARGAPADTALEPSPSMLSNVLVSARERLENFASYIPDLTLFFLAAWLVGTLVLLTKTARDLGASMRMVSNARTIALPKLLASRFQGVRIAVSDEAPGPIAAGVFRPCIILPVGFEAELDRPGIIALLEHERAHVERNDMLVALGQRLVLALLWWSPAMHWISRRMDEEREVACDEAAVERTGDARGFALTLAHQAESQLWASAPRLAVGAIGTRSQFGRRISRLVDLARSAGDHAPQSRGPGRLAFAGLALVALATAVVTPGVKATAQDARDGEPENELGPTHTIVLARADQQPPAPPAPLAPPSVVREPTPITPPTPLAPLPPQDFENFDKFADDMASWGLDLSGLVTDEILSELPGLLEEIFVSLEEAGIGDEDFSAEWREELLDLKEELQRELGPEVRIRIQREIEDARRERSRSLERANAERNQVIAEARRDMAHARADLNRELARARAELHQAQSEITQALSTSSARARYTAEERERMREEVQEALDEAFEQLQEAREKQEFDIDFDFDFDFEDFDAQADAELEGRGPNIGDFYDESVSEQNRALSGPRANPEGASNEFVKRRPAGPSDCPKKG